MQEITLYLYSNCGDLQFNINDVMIAIGMMIDRARKFIRGRLTNDINRNILIDDFTDLNQDIDRLYIDENSSFQSTAIDSKNDNSIYDIVIKYISEGYSPFEGIKLVSKKLKISENDIINVIKNQLYEEGYIYQLQAVN